MTEIKITFTKNKLSHIPADELKPGTRGIELEITTNFLVFDLAGSFEKAVPPADSKVPFEKIAFIFKDSNTETAFYQSLCDTNQKQFEYGPEWKEIAQRYGICEKLRGVSAQGRQETSGNTCPLLPNEASPVCRPSKSGVVEHQDNIVKTDVHILFGPTPALRLGSG